MAKRHFHMVGTKGIQESLFSYGPSGYNYYRYSVDAEALSRALFQVRTRSRVRRSLEIASFGVLLVGLFCSPTTFVASVVYHGQRVYSCINRENRIASVYCKHVEREMRRQQIRPTDNRQTDTEYLQAQDSLEYRKVNLFTFRML